MHHLLFLGILFISACVPSKKDLLKEVPRAASCNIYNSSSVKIACLQFPFNYGSITSACNGAVGDYSAEDAATFIPYGDGTSGCTTSGVAGICSDNGYNHYYYSIEWTIGQAQSACSMIGGTFQ